MSLSKYGYDRRDNSQISFNRARVDGMPFRGPSLPLKEEEYDALTTQVNDFKHDLFDMRDTEQATRAAEILDKAANGWFQVLISDRNWVTENGRTTLLLYIAWIERFRELDQSRVNSIMPLPVPQPLTS